MSKLKPVSIPDTFDEDTGDVYEGDIQLKDDARAARPNELQMVIDYLYQRYQVRYNVLRNELEIAPVGGKKFVQMDDLELNSIVLKMLLDGFKVSEKSVNRILKSDMTEKYNPIEEYFKDLKPWDGKDHIRAYCDRLTLANPDHTKYLYPLVKRWLICSAACALGKVERHEVCWVLIGGQGHGKTTYLDNLCPHQLQEYRVTGAIVPDKKDQVTANYLAEMWFINIDDQLENLFGKDANGIKSVITADDITNRKAYAVFQKRRRRVASFMASVNSSNFLTDTENRRYMCFEVASIDKSSPLPDPAPLWAQVYHLLLNGKEPLKFTAEEKKWINEMNLNYAEITPEMELLQKYMVPAERSDVYAFDATNTEILSFLMRKAPVGMRITGKVLGRALLRLGYVQHSVRNEMGVPTKMYRIRTLSDQDREMFR